MRPAPTDDRSERVADAFRAHGRYVWRSLRYLGVPDGDVPDLVQEVFLIVHRKLDDFDGRSSLRTWIYGIAYRVAIAHHRRARVRLEEITDAPPERIEDAHQRQDLERRRQRELLREAIQQLPLELRVVFVHFEIEGEPMKEVAAMLNLPLQTAYSRLYKARDEVRRSFLRAQLKRRVS
ncbi:MAG: RNA polymerase sigma factor [Myxococcota bacterium]